MSEDPEADAARMLGRVSLLASVAAIISCFIDLTPGMNPQTWEFLLSGGIALAGVVVGLAGMDRRRSCAGPKPVEPIAGIVLGLVTASAIVGFLLFTWGIRHI